MQVTSQIMIHYDSTIAAQIFINKLPTVLAHRASEGSLFKNSNFNGRVTLPTSELKVHCITRSLRRQTNKRSVYASF